MFLTARRCSLAMEYTRETSLLLNYLLRKLTFIEKSYSKFMTQRDIVFIGNNKARKIKPLAISKTQLQCALWNLFQHTVYLSSLNAWSYQIHCQAQLDRQLFYNINGKISILFTLRNCVIVRSQMYTENRKQSCGTLHYVEVEKVVL